MARRLAGSLRRCARPGTVGRVRAEVKRKVGRGAAVPLVPQTGVDLMGDVPTDARLAEATYLLDDQARASRREP